MGAGCPAGAMVGISRSPRPSNTGNQIDHVQDEWGKKKKRPYAKLNGNYFLKNYK